MCTFLVRVWGILVPHFFAPASFLRMCEGFVVCIVIDHILFHPLCHCLKNFVRGPPALSGPHRLLVWVFLTGDILLDGP